MITDRPEEPSPPGNRRAGSLRSDALLFTALASTVAILSALTHAVWALASNVAHVTLREVSVLWIVRYLADAMESDLLDGLPAAVHQSLIPGSGRGLLVFLAGTTLINLAWTLAAATALFGARPFLDRALPGGGPRRTAAAGALCTALFTLPMTVGLIDHFLRSPRQLRTVTLAVLASITLGGAVYVLLNRLRAVRPLLRNSLAISASATVLLAAGAIIASSSGAAPYRPLPQPGAPNILLVSIDSLRADRLHCYGNPRQTSPTIDALAAGGVRFEHAVAPTSWTLPSHMSLMTALPTAVHGVNDERHRLRDDVPTLTTVLRRNGYATAGIVSGTFLDRRFGFDAGFDHYDDYSFVKASGRFQKRGHTAGRLSTLALRWLERWRVEEPKRPFFLFAHYFDVHYDYTPPPPFDTMFDPGYQGPIDGTDIRLSSTIYPGMPPRDLQHLLALYDGEIRSTDAALGRIIRWLGEAGILDRTIVVVVSDHGEEFLEHGEIGHRATLYDEVLRIPMVIRYPPAVPAGRSVDAQVRLMDVAPTVLSLAGARGRLGTFDRGERRSWQAADLAPLFDPATASDVPPLPAFGTLFDRLASLRTNQAKAIRSHTGRHQFYDLSSDPGERTNLWNAGRNPAGAALLGELDVWMRHTSGGSRSAPTRLSREQEEALRSLGYLQ